MRQERITMKYRKYVLFIIFAILLFNPVVTTTGAKNGLLLWFNTIIPSLLPALILTNIIQSTYGSSFKHPSLYIILIGLFCGYPLGASAIVKLEKYRSKDTSNRQLLMAICNISSPSFIMNYIMLSTLKNSVKISILLLIIYIPTLIMVFISQVIAKRTVSSSSISPKVMINSTSSNLDLSSTVIAKPTLEILDTSITSAFETITKLGGYIIIFSIVASYITILPIRNDIAKALLIGAVEITNGIHYIGNSDFSPELKLVLICIVNAFGGLSCAMQTKSIIASDPIATKLYSIKKYIYYKIIIALLTCAVGYLILYVFH